MTSKKIAIFFALAILSLFGVGSTTIHAQVAPSATRETLSLTVGGMVSAFKPDYVPNKLGGIGAYVDVNLFHGIGIEAEGRWQRFNEVADIHQDNYLIGPRVKVLHFWRARPYVKVLGGFSNMTFENDIATGRFTTIAGGGGIDLRLSRRWSVRAIDAEYQVYPKFLGSALTPYGLSAGIGYRIF